MSLERGSDTSSEALRAAYQTRLISYKKRSERALEQGLDPVGGHTAVLDEAMAYALLGGGKRLRPILLYAAADALPGDPRFPEASLDCLAAAIEMVHSYSLVHDDLPCMDNDVLRRGRPTTHVRFGEAQALLAGDALLNRAFELLLQAVAEAGAYGARLLEAGRLMAERFGARGMIGGQCIDLASEGRALERETLNEMHEKKTAALIAAAVLGGACAAGAGAVELACFESYARHLGLAFQIRDDLLDCCGDSQSLGKTVGKDARDAKASYVRLLGEEVARAACAAETGAALKALDQLERMACDVSFLRLLAEELLERKS